MPSDDKHQSSDDGNSYDGPLIVARSHSVGEGWIWVANGTRRSADVFSIPEPIADVRRSDLAPLRVDEAAAAAFVDALRSEAWEVEEGVSEDLTDDSVNDSVDIRAEVAVSQPTGVVVRVLGPVEVVGWIREPDRAIVTELTCYLALHSGRAIPGEELRAALWPDSAREASAKSLRTYMSLMRKALGAESVPVGSAAGYRIGPGVTTDWLLFRELTNSDASPDQLREALELVRGRPFAGVPSTSFGWVFSELLVSEIEVVVVEASRRLAELRSVAGDLAGASWAVRRGLLAVPMDFGLWELHLALADSLGPDERSRARRDAEAALGEDAVELLRPRPASDIE